MNAPIHLPAKRELTLQVHVKNLLLLHAAPGVDWFAVPNGEYRRKRTAGKLKAMGVRAGVADFCITLPPNGRAAYLELKTIYGSQSDDQTAFEKRIVGAGGLYALANSYEQAEAVLYGWGAITETPSLVHDIGRAAVSSIKAGRAA